MGIGVYFFVEQEELNWVLGGVQVRQLRKLSNRPGESTLEVLRDNKQILVNSDSNLRV